MTLTYTGGRLPEWKYFCSGSNEEDDEQKWKIYMQLILNQVQEKTIRFEEYASVQYMNWASATEEREAYLGAVCLR